MGPDADVVRLHLLTAVHAALTDHLHETAASVSALRSRLAETGTEVLWHVVVDGAGEQPERLDDADTFQVAARQIGVSAARNMALAATSGDGWVFRLDGDDTLDVDGWEALLADPRFGSTPWHPTNLTDQDGQPTPHWFAEPRRWEAREVEEQWTSPMPFHPNDVVARADLVLAIGGWPAMRVNEDILWCFGLNQHAPGLALPYVTLRYRRWERQTVSDDRYLADKDAAFRFIEAVTNARRATAGLSPVRAPRPGAGTLYLPTQKPI